MRSDAAKCCLGCRLLFLYVGAVLVASYVRWLHWLWWTQ